jgi:hypothetical protein
MTSIRLDVHPEQLIVDLIDLLPEELFVSSTTTFVDFQMGSGTFLKSIFSRLIKYGHSKENIIGRLYGGEKNEMYLQRAKIFWQPDNFTVIKSSEEIKTAFPNMKFDVSVNNPPFQNSQNTGNPIWQHHVKEIFNRVKEGGYVVNIHPSGWRNGNAGRYSEIHDILFSKNIQVLSIHSSTEGLKTFNAGTRYDWYITKNEPYVGPTQIRFEGEGKFIEIDLSDWNCIPNFAYHMWKDLKKFTPGLDFVRYRSADAIAKNYWVSTKPKEGHDYLIINTINHDKVIKHYSSRLQEEIAGKKKVMIPEGGYPYAIYDDGKHGSGCGCLSMIVESEEEGQTIINFLRSKVGWAIIMSTKWSNFRTPKGTFMYVPNPYKLGLNPTSTDGEIYQALNLSEEAINEIEMIESGNHPYTSKRSEFVSINSQQQFV